MSAPTRIERDHYAKVIGRQITAIIWEEMEGRALPVLCSTAGTATATLQQPQCLPIRKAMGRGIWITTCDSAAFGRNTQSLN